MKIVSRHRLILDGCRDLQRLYGLCDIMGADDPRAASGRDQMRGDRAAQPLLRLRRRQRRQ